MTHQEWVDSRQHSVGASEVAAVLGLNPYQGPHTVALRKLGKVSGAATSDAIELGILFEPKIFEVWQRKMQSTSEGEWTFGTCSWVLQHPECPMLTTNLDGWGERQVTLEMGPEEGERSASYLERFVVEIKHVGIYARQAWKQYKETGEPCGIFLSYWLQVQAQLAVTGFDHGYLVTLIDKQLDWVRVQADEDAIKSMLTEVDAFWRLFIMQGLAPEPDERDLNTIKKIWPREEEGKTIERHDLAEMVAEFRELKAQKKALTTEHIKPVTQKMGDLEAKIAAEMQDAELMNIGSDLKPVTYKTTIRAGYTVKSTQKRSLKI